MKGPFGGNIFDMYEEIAEEEALNGEWPRTPANTFESGCGPDLQEANHVDSDEENALQQEVDDIIDRTTPSGKETAASMEATSQSQGKMEYPAQFRSLDTQDLSHTKTTHPTSSPGSVVVLRVRRVSESSTDDTRESDSDDAHDEPMPPIGVFEE